MMKLNVGKSALLAVTMMVGVPVSTTRAEEIAPIATSLMQNKTFQAIAAVTAFIAYVDMKTNSNKEMFETTLTEDYQKLVESFDVLDTKSYKNVAMLLRKIIVGRPIKFVQKDIPQEDGSTIKGKKAVSQEPYGVLGLFDGYVLSQIKDFSEHIPALAGLYVLLGSPELAFQNAFKKASGDTSK